MAPWWLYSLNFVAKALGRLISGHKLSVHMQVEKFPWKQKDQEIEGEKRKEEEKRGGQVIWLPGGLVSILVFCPVTGMHCRGGYSKPGSSRTHQPSLCGATSIVYTQLDPNVLSTELSPHTCVSGVSLQPWYTRQWPHLTKPRAEGWSSASMLKPSAFQASLPGSVSIARPAGQEPRSCYTLHHVHTCTKNESPSPESSYAKWRK